MSTELPHLNAFNLIPHLGPVRLRHIFKYFASAERAWRASAGEFRASKMEQKVIQEIVERRKTIDPEAEFAKLQQEDISIITIQDRNYPELLKEIYDPPVLLYYQGQPLQKNTLCLAIVGTRKPSLYGIQVTAQLTQELCQSGLITVSGLALGIDTLVHKTTLENNKSTLAIIGSGLDKKTLYPQDNLKLAQEIITNNGSVVSEYPIGTPPLKQNFPCRNRIISGISLGTLVTEAPKKSGALITAQSALDQNREVFAVPGSVLNKSSVGPHQLIQQGAKLVQTGQDVLDALSLNLVTDFVENRKIIPENPEEEILLQYLSKEPIQVDKLIQLSKLDSAKVNATLAMMEMKGSVKNLGRMNYVLNR